MRITVQHAKNSLDFIEKGDTITFEKEKNNAKDPKAIRAFIDKQFIGYVSVSGSTIAPGTSSGHDIFDIVKDEFDGKVVDYASLTNQTGATRIGIVVDLAVEEPKAEISNESYNLMFKVKGGVKTYPGKALILDDVLNKKLKTFVNLSLDANDKVLILRQEGSVDSQPSGVIEEKNLTNCSSVEDLQLVKDLLRNGEDLEAKVVKVEKASYFISLQLSSESIQATKTEIAKKSVNEKKEELVDMGFDKDLLNEIEDYLLDCEFTPTDIENLFDTYQVYPKEIQHLIIKKPETLFKDTFGAMKVLWAAAANGFHVLESGERGTGKNVAVETWAWITQRPLFTMSISSETDKLDLLGSKTIDADIENGQVVNSIKFEPELVARAMEYNGILNLDEVNFGSPAVLGVLHSVMDTRREISIPGYKQVKAENNFMVICTINESYLGTNSLNEAFRDRMVNLRFPNNPSIYDVLERACPTASKGDIQKVDRVYQKMYSIIQDRDSALDEDCMTVRGPIQALTMAPILGLKKALKIAMIKTQDDEYAKNIETIIDNII